MEPRTSALVRGRSRARRSSKLDAEVVSAEVILVLVTGLELSLQPSSSGPPSVVAKGPWVVLPPCEMTQWSQVSLQSVSRVFQAGDGRRRAKVLGPVQARLLAAGLEGGLGHGLAWWQECASPSGRNVDVRGSDNRLRSRQHHIGSRTCRGHHRHSVLFEHCRVVLGRGPKRGHQRRRHRSRRERQRRLQRRWRRLAGRRRWHYHVECQRDFGRATCRHRRSRRQ